MEKNDFLLGNDDTDKENNAEQTDNNDNDFFENSEFIEPQEESDADYAAESSNYKSITQPPAEAAAKKSAKPPRTAKEEALLRAKRRKQLKKAKKVAKKVFRTGKKAFGILGSTILSLFMIVVITGTIIVAALTVYVLKFMDETYEIDLYDIQTSSPTSILGTDPETGEYVQLYYVENDSMSIPIEIDVVPQHTMNAFVYAEDERFFLHDGVDYKRTLAAFVNMFISIYDTDQGGSTITQQLVKNITGDDARGGTAGPERKIREIFRAMNLEERYAKLEILEAYMNYISFGGGAVGVEYAAEKYFGKTVSELSIAESAALAAIPKSPEKNNPNAGYYLKVYNEATGIWEVTDEWVNTGIEENKGRQEYILYKMFENGAITRKEYEDAVAEELIFVGSEKHRQMYPEYYANEDEKLDDDGVTSYVVDAALMELAEIFQEERGLSYTQALKEVNSGGYTIYVTADLAMQEYLEEKYLDYYNIYGEGYAQKAYDAEGNPILEEDGSNLYVYPNSSFIVMDYYGNIQAVIGGIGEKTSSLGLLRPMQSQRQPGSCIKPVSTYGYALENDVIHWSSIYVDKPLTINGESWPHNFSSWSYSNKFIYRAIEVSLNTIPAQLCYNLTPDNIYTFMVNKLHFDSLVASDIDLAPLSVGGLTNGVTLNELCNAYIPYGNGGYMYESTIISMVYDAEGNVVVDHQNKFGEQAVSGDTAYIMNRMLRRVVENSHDGTGRQANLDGVEVVGKTGTSQNFRDLGFVGLTPDYVSAIWYGFDNDNSSVYTSSGSNSFGFYASNYPKSAQIWANVFGEYAEMVNAQTMAEFPVDEGVVMEYFCNSTGLIAGPNCSKCSVPGYYKTNAMPGVCTSCRAAAPPAETTPATTTPAAETTTTSE